jgi:hypothetical protein
MVIIRFLSNSIPGNRKSFVETMIFSKFTLTENHGCTEPYTAGGKTG